MSKKCNYASASLLLAKTAVLAIGVTCLCWAYNNASPGRRMCWCADRIVNNANSRDAKRSGVVSLCERLATCVDGKTVAVCVLDRLDVVAV